MGRASFHSACVVGGAVLIDCAAIDGKNSRRTAIAARTMAAIEIRAVNARSSRSAAISVLPFRDSRVRLAPGPRERARQSAVRAALNVWHEWLSLIRWPCRSRQELLREWKTYIPLETQLQLSFSPKPVPLGWPDSGTSPHDIVRLRLITSPLRTVVLSYEPRRRCCSRFRWCTFLCKASRTCRSSRRRTHPYYT